MGTPSRLNQCGTLLLHPEQSTCVKWSGSLLEKERQQGNVCWVVRLCRKLLMESFASFLTIINKTA
jgi:hypothetical protein